MILSFPLVPIDRIRQMAQSEGARADHMQRGQPASPAGTNAPSAAPFAGHMWRERKRGAGDMTSNTPSDILTQGELLGDLTSAFARSQESVARLSKPCTRCKHYDGAHNAGGCSVRLGLYELDGSFVETGWCGCALTGGAKWDATSAIARAFAVGRVTYHKVEDCDPFSLLPAQCALCGERVRRDGFGFFSPVDNRWSTVHRLCGEYAIETGEVRPDGAA